MLYVIGLLVIKDTCLPQTTVQHLRAEEPRDTDVQERICSYHGSLEDVMGSKDFGTGLGVYDSFINEFDDGITKGDPNEDGYKGPLDSPDID